MAFSEESGTTNRSRSLPDPTNYLFTKGRQQHCQHLSGVTPSIGARNYIPICYNYGWKKVCRDTNRKYNPDVFAATFVGNLGPTVAALGELLQHSFNGKQLDFCTALP